MNLEECYEAIESDYDDVMRRLGSETLVRKFVLKFLDDTSFQGLKEGLEPIRAVIPINLLLLLILVHIVYVLIRWYVKGCMRSRGYY